MSWNLIRTNWGYGKHRRYTNMSMKNDQRASCGDSKKCTDFMAARKKNQTVEIIGAEALTAGIDVRGFRCEIRGRSVRYTVLLLREGKGSRHMTAFSNSFKQLLVFFLPPWPPPWIAIRRPVSLRRQYRQPKTAQSPSLMPTYVSFRIPISAFSLKGEFNLPCSDPPGGWLISVFTRKRIEEV